ncbi:HAMP domain-containing methyl-accepting chemotaxis protein [Shewanella algae]|uniref:methyl-accepting chemotaxis protein n=1 Tax=Shewanella algae TaxID=38313 RepID=UPI000D646109|nr:HAMP domain-containing methyl-accepting chemotaxis protein [Shewanella algae]AXQ13349.1 methyl-accepting chemotaxis protein [Shewanella algae]MBC8797438.1 methyl-accepting chemotaxis protein [Shewanella algae]PWF91841.1 methyl-accepting chemotaxis protein [Shewanella algae]QXP19765.1 HAMP domain-containing methyl-accepting chemotaxis protein [Shewanella algae]QXP29384.1 HAMP domain-containing methyl-accepting chemotaxis protein [Shewanella algae]
MKLNVATRVIAGFAVVTLLLILLGAVSWFTNNELKNTTEVLQQLSIPALKSTGELGETLSEQQRLVLVGYHVTKANKLPPIQQQFASQKQNFKAQFASLSKLVQHEPGLKEILPQVERNYQAFINTSERMMADHLSALEQQESLNKQRDQLETTADDAASLLLDLMDLEQSQDTTEREIAASAAALDSNVTNVISTVYDLVATEERSKYEIIVKELSYIINEAEAKLEYISRHGAGVIDADVLSEMNSELGKLSQHFKGKNSIQAQKATQLELKASTQVALNQVETDKKNVNQAMGALSGAIETLTNEINAKTLASIDSASMQTLLVVLVAIVVAIAVSIAVVKPLTASLNRINQALNILASGDLTHKLDDSGQDEFAELSRNCNRLIDSLRGLIRGILDRSNQLAAAAEQTSAVTSQTTIGIQEQKSQVDQVATATTELSSSAQQVSHSADHALNQIKQADEEAQHMRMIAEENRRTIEALAEEVAKAGQVINKVHSDSDAIGSILDVIRGIAEQTNLLALNAAIEAARAGEQGRGFAVVADEVRNLASRTQESTQEIQQMIQVLQTGTQEAVAVMEQGRAQANSCVAKTEQANQALEAISESVHQAFDAGTQIANAAQEQNLVSQQVSEKLEHIALISEETASGADQTAQSSHQVAQLAEELQASVGEFKV